MQSSCKHWKCATQRTGRDDFGLVLAQHQSIAIPGPIGQAIQEAPTVGEAILTASRFSNLYVTGMEIRLSIRGTTATSWVEAADAPSLAFAVRQDHAIALGTQVIRHLIGSDWCPDIVHLAHRKPANLDPYLGLLRCPVLFDQEITAMSFPKSLLGHSIETACAQKHQQLLGELQSASARVRQSTTERIRYAILSQVQEGDYHIDTVARKLGMTRRSLQRRLHEEDTNFSDLLITMRIETAKRFLSSTSIPITQISNMLGYSETSAFSRAFAARTGVSPRGWRQTGGMPRPD